MKRSQFTATRIAAACMVTLASQAGADVVTDWNTIADTLVVQSRMGTPPAVRVMAIVQTAVHEAVTAAPLVEPGDGAGAAAEAAVAAANRATLMKLLPQQTVALEAAYKVALAKVADGPAKAAGIAVGEQAAARVLAWRADDGATAAEAYRPHTSPGGYVPTTPVAAPQWPQRKPWLMDSASQFRPAPPPALTSAEWARDFNEVKALGSKSSRLRTPEQTEIAKFWEFSLPPIYNAVTRSVAAAPGRTVAQNARLLAAASQAMDDAVIAVLEAKYHYGFWRPVTAIRNGDRDDNAATEIEPGWSPLIDNPGHPEYPSAHSILAATVGELLKAEVGTKRMPELSTHSPSANGAIRRWSSADAFMEEVASARVWEGIHYRFSVNAGLAMGKQIAALAASKVAQSPATAAIPQALAPRAGGLVETLAARGSQIYECRADATAPGGARWIFAGPRADLYDRSGRAVGKHYDGPNWEAADGSRIVGAVEARVDAPQADAVPWLLLSARSAGGSGRFAQVTSVQRVNTIGGNVPHQPCDSTAVGLVQPVQYSADYLFYGS
jgi:hypothetical protein